MENIYRAMNIFNKTLNLNDIKFRYPSTYYDNYKSERQNYKYLIKIEKSDLMTKLYIKKCLS